MGIQKTKIIIGGIYTYSANKQLVSVISIDSRRRIARCKSIIDGMEYNATYLYLEDVAITQDWLNVFWNLSSKCDELPNIYQMGADDFLKQKFKNINDLMQRGLIWKNVFSFTTMQSGWVGAIQVHAKLKHEAILLICEHILKKQPSYYISKNKK